MIQSGANRGDTGQTTRGYYPLSPPTKFPPEVSADRRAETSRLPSYDPVHDSLPLRSHQDYIHDGRTSSADPKIDHADGIKGVSPFADLPTMSFPVTRQSRGDKLLTKG